MTLYDGKLYEYDSLHLNVSKLEVPNIVVVFLFFFASLFSFVLFLES